MFTLDMDLAALPNDTEHTNKAEETSPDTKQNETDDLSDILSDFEFEPQGTESSELDRIFADLAKGPKVEHTEDGFSRVTLDKTDEEVGQGNPDIINEEKRLFENIFDTYAREEREPLNSSKLESEVLWNLQQSFTNPGRKVHERPVVHERLSQNAIRKCLDKAKAAIGPTLDHISSLSTQGEVVQFLQDVLHRYDAKEYDEESFYLHKHNLESMSRFMARADKQFQKAEEVLAQTPQQPYLHEYVMPVVFNHAVKLLSNKFYNGQLALSLFNSLKKDLNLYTVMCNQDTYNEMLKVYWVFMGRSSLCEIELLFVEMTNNGFQGDMTTFAILKELLGDYHTMRMGKSLYNPGGEPIWSLEDEKRATKLGEKLRVLAKHLRNTKA